MLHSAAGGSTGRSFSGGNNFIIIPAVRIGARGREYEYALQWLENAGLICKSRNVSFPGIPLAAYANRNIFKTYVLDIGLLGALSKLSPDILIGGMKFSLIYLAHSVLSCISMILYGNVMLI